MTSEAQIKQRAEVFGDLHYKDGDEDFFNVTVGGNKSGYILIRTDEQGNVHAHYNVPVRNVPSVLVEMAFQVNDRLVASKKELGQ